MKKIDHIFYILTAKERSKIFILLFMVIMMAFLDMVGLASIMPLNRWGHDYTGDVFNVGSGKNYSIQQIADCISDNQVYIDKRDGEMETTLADISKIGSVIGWQPEIDVLEWVNGQK